MPATLIANSHVPAGVSPPGSLLVPYDSGNIVAQNAPGKPPVRLTTGLQQQASTLTGDSTSGTSGNFIATGSPQASPNPPATITNILIVTSGNVSSCVVTATNSFVIGNTVRFALCTTVAALNGFSMVITAATGSNVHGTLVGFTVPSVGSSAETGTMTLNYYGKQACLSMLPNN